MKIAHLLMGMVLAGCVQAQDLREWKANFRITDEANRPVTNAAVTVFYDRMPGTSGKVTGFTDANGLFEASHRDRTGGLAFIVSKDGYYKTTIQDDFSGIFTPEELNQDLNLVLKKVGNPIEMYAKRVKQGPPAFNVPVGYDLVVGDWVTPYGKGETKDVIFTGNLNQKAKNDFDYKLVVTFSKTNDGIQEFPISESEKGSSLRSPHEAPASGYQAEVIKTMSHHPGVGSHDDMNDPNRNYFFRIRTILDDKGNVKSALYGKIYGDFMQFSYYLDPTPNDRNIEFDPKQNLLKGLKSVEQVSTP